MLIAVGVLVFAGAAVAAVNRGGVIESRGSAEPTREFVPPRARRAPRPKRVVEPSVDSIAASVRDSVALLLGQPVPQTPKEPRPFVPPPQSARDPSGPRQGAPDDAALPPVDMRTVNRDLSRAAEMTAANARMTIDSATRRDVKPTFTTKLSSSPRP